MQTNTASDNSANNITISSIDPQEQANFAKMAETWWDPNGPMKPLHMLHPLRMDFVVNQIALHFGRYDDIKFQPDNGSSPGLHAYDEHNLGSSAYNDYLDDGNDKILTHRRPNLSGVNILDIGCGGGLVSEPLAVLGANVLGIDMVEKNIHTASYHRDHIQTHKDLALEYQHSTVEQLVANNHGKFDVICCLEVIEHVANPAEFMANTMSLLKDDGIFIGSTINRNLKSYMAAIFIAEYVLGWLPKGTHSWQKLVKPSEFVHHIEKSNWQLQELQGFKFNPLSWKWQYSDNTDINYILSATNRN